MPLALAGSLAAAGLLAGWAQRAALVRLAIPAPPVLVLGGVTALLLGALAARVPGGPVPGGLVPGGLVPGGLVPGGLVPGGPVPGGPVPGGTVPGGLVLAAACWLAVCAVPLAFTDLAVSRLPDPLTAAAYAGTAVLELLAAAAGPPAAGGHQASWSALLRAVLGGLALAGFYLLLMVISPSGMSLGDVKLAASLGTLLAWFGWRELIAGGAAGFLLGGLGAVVLLAIRRAGRKQLIPFGPFMIAGAFLVVLAMRL